MVPSLTVDWGAIMPTTGRRRGTLAQSAAVGNERIVHVLNDGVNDTAAD
jgi:hypothetical protein